MTKRKMKKICEKYSPKDEDGFTHCPECPLRVEIFLCKRFSHYSRKWKRWVGNTKN